MADAVLEVKARMLSEFVKNETLITESSDLSLV